MRRKIFMAAGMIVIIGVVFLLWRREAFIRTHVIVEPGIPEEQIVESEDYELKITEITYQEQEPDPQLKTWSKERQKEWIKTWKRYMMPEYFKIQYEFTNNSEETVVIYGKDSIVP